MSLYLYNTKTRTKELFVARNTGHVSMYHCGPTVYDFVHLGNLRAYIFADTLRRIFEYEGFKVSQIINITDVGHLTTDADEGEDKVLQKAVKEKKTPQEIATFYMESFKKDLAALNIKTKGTEFPKASEHVPEQIALIKKLEQRGYVYTTRDGVYFNTSKFPDYGKLARLNISGLREGARIEKNPEKKYPTDFALWKFSKKDTHRAQEWDSPWGKGFPGWHTECSAMAMKYLGETLDIHTSGIDHIPTHHTNEVAQSEAATGKTFVRYFMHNNHLLIENEKMSKSLGNFTTLFDVSEKGISPLAYRYLLLGAHYRTLINFTWEALEGASRSLSKLSLFYLSLDETDSRGEERAKEYGDRFKEYIEDDIDAPGALALLWIIVKDDGLGEKEKKELLKDFDRVFGLGFADLKKEPLPAHVEVLADERKGAREEEDWARSDSLRKKIEKAGYSVKDTPEGQEITKKL
ncbi:MAG: cysteine--tRNA ligase [Candidatus Paceibacterota bacterium]